MTQVHRIAAFSDNYIWLIRIPDKSNPVEAAAAVAIVDPGDAKPVIAALESLHLNPAAILITHHHQDHIGGIPELLSRYPVPVYGPAAMRGTTIHHPLHDSDMVLLGDSMRLRVIEVPGHTADHIAYYGDGMLFCGDTLFAGGCGRLFEGTAQQMYESLAKLAALPDETSVYCAHEYTLANLRFAVRVEPDNHRLKTRLAQTVHLREHDNATIPATLAEEKATNPFLRCHMPAVRQAAERFCDRVLTSNVEVFAVIRRWKDIA